MKSLAAAATLLTLSILLLPPAPAGAEDVVVQGGSLKSTSRYFRIDYDAQGVATVVPLVKVLPPSGSPPGVPTDPTPSPTTLRSAVRDKTAALLAQGAAKNTAARLSAVYSVVSSSVATGSVAHDRAVDAVREATNLALLGQPDAERWQPLRAEIGEALTLLAQQGELGTKAQVSKALKDVADGLADASGFTGVAGAQALGPNAGILDGIDIGKIIELIKLIMQLLELFKPK